MKPNRILGTRALFILLVAGWVALPSAAGAQTIVRVGTVGIEPREAPEGWTLVTDTSRHIDALASKNADNLTSEILLRIKEAELNASLSSCWTQKFECDGKLVEIEYFGGVADADMARAYSAIALRGLADAVVHKGRFAIAIHSPSPSLIRTAVDALSPAPLDRIKVIDAFLPEDERAQSESLANPIMRENLAKHFEIVPIDVLNQFFQGPSVRQITYVACASLDDASSAADRVREMSAGKTRVLAEGRYVVEIVGDDTWSARVERMIMPRLLELASDEQKAREAARNAPPSGTG